MGKRRFTSDELYAIRNNIPVGWVITGVLKIESKREQDIIRFQCPVCGEFNTAINRTSNLARCFLCQRNFNPIDLMMAARQMDFIAAVSFLQQVQGLRAGEDLEVVAPFQRRATAKPIAVGEILQRIASQALVNNEH